MGLRSTHTWPVPRQKTVEHTGDWRGVDLKVVAGEEDHRRPRSSWRWRLPQELYEGRSLGQEVQRSRCRPAPLSASTETRAVRLIDIQCLYCLIIYHKRTTLHP